MGGGGDIPQPVHDRQKSQVTGGIADGIDAGRNAHVQDAAEPATVRKPVPPPRPQPPRAAAQQHDHTAGPQAIAGGRSPGEPLPAQAWQTGQPHGQGKTRRRIHEVHHRHGEQAGPHVSCAPEHRHADMDDHHRRERRQHDGEIPRGKRRASAGQTERSHEAAAEHRHRSQKDDCQSRGQEQRLRGRPSGAGKITRSHTPRHERRGGNRRHREEAGQETQAVGDDAHCGQRLGPLQEIAGEPFVGEAHRQPQHLLQKHREQEHRPNQLQHGRARSGRAGYAPTNTRRPIGVAAQVNSSLITLPELAIFIGRPFLAVKVVSREMPSDLSTLAITSCDE